MIGHLLTLAIGFGAGLWAGFKLWKQTYVAGLDGRRNLGGRL